MKIMGKVCFIYMAFIRRLKINKGFYLKYRWTGGADFGQNVATFAFVTGDDLLYKKVIVLIDEC